MKMEVPGLEKVGRILGKMGTDVDGRGWVVNPMMGPQNGKKWYILILPDDNCIYLIIDLGFRGKFEDVLDMIIPNPHC